MTRPLGTALVVFLGFGALPAAAESLDVFGGYSFLRRSETGFHGAEVTATLHVSSKLGIAADVARHQATVLGLDATVLTAMAGPRLSLGGGGLRLYLRAMVGIAHTGESVGGYSGSGVGRTDLGVLAGMGIDHALTKQVGLRLSADYLGINATEEWTSQPRASLGITYKF
jgi:opacity protein-like surface antigen